MNKYHIYNIEWDTDGEDCENLPKEVLAEFENEMDYDEISDWLSDKYGFCHFGFKCEMVK